MKILQVIPYFNPKRGGDVNICYNLSRHLAKRGYDVTILTTNFEFDEQFADSIKKENIKIISVHCVASLGLFLYTPSIKKWLKKNIRYYDIIHMHTYRAYQNIIIWKYARKYNIPYIVQAHGSLLTFFIKPLLKKLYDMIWGYKLLKDASKVIALTETEKEQYKEMGIDEEKIEIVPNGIDLSEYEDLPERGKFRKKYEIKDGEKIVLYLGRLHKIKGLDLLVEAFADLTKKIDNIRLVIVGPDDGFLSILKSQIEKLGINEKVLLTGPLYGKDKLEVYVDADVYVLPSRYETFPNTVLEAFACETPVIVTDRCGISNIVNEGGCVIEYDKNQLKEAIVRILNDSQLRITYGKKGKKLVEEKYDWNKIAGRIEKIYREHIQEMKQWREKKKCMC